MPKEKALQGSIQEKNGKYYAVIGYNDVITRKRKMKWIGLGFGTDDRKADVNKAFREAVRKFEQEYKRMCDGMSSPYEYPLVAFLNNWLDKVKIRSVQKSTFHGYKSLVNGKIARFFGDKFTLGDLNIRTVTAFYETFRAKNRSESTVLRYHNLLHEACKYAVRQEILDSNPMDKVDRPKQKKYRGNYYSPEKVQTLLSMIKDDVIYMPVLLAAYTCFCEKQFKDGSYRKCRDNKLHDEKYLKENMEYEFTIRQQILAALAGGADPDEYADTDTRRNPAGSRDSRADRRSTFGYGTNHFGTYPADKTDAGNAERDGRTTQEGPLHDTESAGGNENTSAGERRTGWEDTRPSLTADGKIRFAGRGNLVASSATHMSSGHSRLALGGLSGLASAVSMIGSDDPDESEEAKKEREARENGSALGALIGTAIGAVTAINARCSNENTQEEQAPDIVQTPDIGENEGESEHPFELSM